MELEDLKVEEFEITNAIRLLYYWQYSEGDSFHCILYGLFQKADATNLPKLKKGFPAEYVAWRMWQGSPTQDEFFKDRGLDPELMTRRGQRRQNGFSAKS
jgi:hypothetical protein